MKNLHNFERLQGLVPLLKDPKTFATKAGYFLSDIDEMKHLARIAVAMERLGMAFPDILTEEWHKQKTKQDWAKFCYENYGIDESGRVASAVLIIPINPSATANPSGEALKIYGGSTVNPPSRQRWIPSCESDKIKASILMQELKKEAAMAKGEALHEDFEMDHILSENMYESFSYAKVFYVKNGRVFLSTETPVSVDMRTFTVGRTKYSLAEAKAQLQKFVDTKHKEHTERRLKGEAQSGHDDMYDAFREEIVKQWQGATKTGRLAMGYGAGTQDFLIKTEDMKKLQRTSDLRDMKPICEKETTTMNLTQKATAFLGNLKAIGGDLLRVQRGRATLHSAKRVIFAALPFKWGILARVTGKAKKVENHPLTDLALAFALHGATNFAISDVAKREKYLKFTEEMLVAAGYSASLKMLPIEDMLDKIFSGVGDSEAVGKLKDLLADKVETAAGESGIAAHKPA